jgi:hypothetical protein
MILQARNPADLWDLQLSLSEMATTAYSMFSQLQSLVVQPIVPPQCTFGKIKSLYLQGHNAWATGLKVRPQFPQQRQLFEVLHRFLVEHNSMEILPQLELDMQVEEWPQDLARSAIPFEERNKILKAAQRRTRLRRVSPE